MNALSQSDDNGHSPPPLLHRNRFIRSATRDSTEHFYIIGREGTVSGQSSAVKSGCRGVGEDEQENSGALEQKETDASSTDVFVWYSSHDQRPSGNNGFLKGAGERVKIFLIRFGDDLALIIGGLVLGFGIGVQVF